MKLATIRIDATPEFGQALLNFLTSNFGTHVSTTTTTPQPQATQLEQPRTIDEVRDLLVRVQQSVGTPAAQQVLSQFNATKVSEIKDLNGAFRACEAALAK